MPSRLHMSILEVHRQSGLLKFCITSEFIYYLGINSMMILCKSLLSRNIVGFE